MDNRKLISILIPVYRSTNSVEEIANNLFDLSKNIDRWDFEVIFVNDSPFYKPTCDKLSKIEHNFREKVKVVTLRKNIGQQLAVLVGLKKTSGDLVITMDDDLQHPVSEIPKMITKMEENPGLDVCFAIPGFSNKKHNFIRTFGSWFISKIDNLTLERPNGLVKSSFRIFKSELIPNILKAYTASPAVSDLILKVTHNIENIKVAHRLRKYGDSNYSFNKLLRLTFNNIVYNSSLPLAFIGYVGVFSFLGSFVFILITVIRKLFYGIGVPGYASQVVLISFFGGMTLLGLGIIGEYLIRIVKELNKPDLDNFISDE